MDFADIVHGGYFLCYRRVDPGQEERGEVCKDRKNAVRSSVARGRG